MSDADPRRLFHAHVDAVHGYVARRLGRDDAMDVVSEVFEIALRQRERFDPSMGSERGWLFGIATNLIRRHWRTEQRHLRALERLAVRPSSAIDPLLRVDDQLDAGVLAGRVHPELLVATMSAALDGLPTVTASATRTENTTTIEIDRGATHGLEVGMPVVDEAGVIGKLAQVDDESSIVMLVVHDAYVIEARVDYGGSASFVASAVGGGDSLLRLTPELGRNGDSIARPGTLVVTEGGPSSLAPPGLPLGTVTTRADDTSPRVRPSADLENPDLVDAVLYRPSVPESD